MCDLVSETETRVLLSLVMNAQAVRCDLAGGSGIKRIAREFTRGGPVMSRKRHKTEPGVNLPRQVEVAIAIGRTTPQAAREAGIPEQTYYHWRKEFVGLKLDQARRDAMMGAASQD